MYWGQKSPFPIDFAHGPYLSTVLTHCLWLVTASMYRPVSACTWAPIKIY